MLLPLGNGGLFAEAGAPGAAKSKVKAAALAPEKVAAADGYESIRDCVIYLFPEQFPGDPAFQSVATGLGSLVLREDTDTSQEILEISIEHDIINPSWAAVYRGAPGDNPTMLVELPSADSPISYVFTAQERDALLVEQDLFIQIGSDDLPEGELFGYLSCIVAIPPANDTCDTATEI